MVSRHRKSSSRKMTKFLLHDMRITYDAVLVHNIASRANLLANRDIFILRLLGVNANDAKRQCCEGEGRKANHYIFCERSINNGFK